MEMEQYAISVGQCKSNLCQYSELFRNVSAFLEDQRNTITDSAENLVAIRSNCFQQLRGAVVGYIPQDESIRAGENAREIGQAKCNIEASFQIYRKGQNQVFSLDNGQQEEEPKFVQWLNSISALRHLFPKQHAQEETITLWEIQIYVEFALNNLDQLHTTLINVCSVLENAKHEAIKISDFLYAENLLHLSCMDLSQFYSMSQTIDDLKSYIFQKHAFVITKQPQPVLMKTDKKPSGNLRDRKVTTTKTDISVKLLNVFGLLNSNKQIPIKIRLINENQAQDIQRNAFRERQELNEIQIYRCDASTSDSTNFITTNLEMESVMSANVTENASNIFSAHIPNISVIKGAPIRQRKASNDDKVIKKKYYFLITAELPISHNKGTFVTAWTLSTPVVLRTHSVHIEGALATTSWTKYFSYDTTDGTQDRSYGKISEIRDILQTHFQEWTCYKDKSGKKASLSLNNDHLNFLIDMLLEHVCGEVSKEDFIASHDVPLAHFYYQKLENRDFSFWSWFYKASCIFQKEYFRELWKKSYIAGFIGKPEAYMLLQKNGMCVGDFIVRFSQSVEAEFCVVFVNHDRKVIINPLKLDKSTDKKFKVTFLRSMYKYYLTGSQLQQAFIRVYPNISKWDAFPKVILIDEPHQPRRPDSVEFIPYVYDKPTIAQAENDTIEQ